MSEEYFPFVVVGAGMAGLAAAYTLGKAGIPGVVLERGNYPGAKNVLGGILYRKMLEDVLGEEADDAPRERLIQGHYFWLLQENSVVELGYQDFLDKGAVDGFTILRSRFDRWLAAKIEKKGVPVLSGVLVTGLIRQNGRVVGVEIDREPGRILTDCVLVAEGVNGKLVEQIFPDYRLETEDVALSVKEIIALPPEKIEERFALSGSGGVGISFFGFPLAGKRVVGFLYTNRESISIGLGIYLSDLIASGAKPYELLEKVKTHPRIKPYLEGGDCVEYSAHLLPEGGYRRMPQLFGQGFLLLGDAAGLVNPLFREGANLALISGKLAGITVSEAFKTKDFSHSFLHRYKRYLKKSFVLQDLYRFRHLPRLLSGYPNFLSLYPEWLGFIFREFLRVDGIPKKEKQQRVWRWLRSRVTYRSLIRDFWGLRRVLY